MMTLKQLWCGVTTGHEYLVLALSEEQSKAPELIHSVTLECLDCGHQREAITGVFISQICSWSRRKLSELFQQTAANGAGVTLATFGGPITKVPKPFNHKAYAAGRRRGPNGQFLPVLTEKKVKAFYKKLTKGKKK